MPQERLFQIYFIKKKDLYESYSENFEIQFVLKLFSSNKKNMFLISND